MTRSRLHFFLATTWLLFTSAASAADSIDFSREILPILSNKCFACHGPDAKDKELRLDSFEAATADRGDYRALDPNQPAESEILVRIHDEDDPMPPRDAEKQLTEVERLMLDRWVRQGGQYAKHWAFIPPTKPEAHQEIDGFIEEAIESKFPGKGLAPEADRATLARRAALTLTGLPPDPEALADFMDDTANDAYERYVDGLLDSPRYGEHQARYWLDAVRYGDTHGLHLDNRRGIYPYRDWVVRALNANLPLDQFITWQLAGDLLPDPSLAQLVATGYVRMNPTTSEGGVLPEEFQAKNNFDRTETFGTVFLGMTLTCARCHTHKYDPIEHTEYFQLLAFFNSTAESPLDGNKYDYGPAIKAPPNQAAWDAWERTQKESAELLSQLDPNPTEGTWREQLATLADEEGSLKSHAAHAPAKRLLERVEELEGQFTSTLVAKDRVNPRPTHVLSRGEYNLPTGDPLNPGVPSVMGDLPENTQRNRLGLAQWLTSREHPLVARVLINRVWQRVYGDGLVRTPEDFGAQGEQPTHPELLDWLAVELQDSGWDLKHMLRLMVTSKTFKQVSAQRSDLTDPENKLFSRGPNYRLDAEVLRDIALWSSGLLDPYMGGEGVKPYQPSGMWLAMAHPASNTKKYERDHGDKLYRRSLYVYWKRTSPHPMMTLFDAPSREASCVRRSRSSTSLQSLALFNEIQRLEMARVLAQRLLHERQTDEARLDHLFSLLACRPPDASERRACLTLLNQMKERFQGDAESARSLLAVGDAPQDDRLDPTEHAAWTQVTTTVLASDLALLLY